MIGVLTSLWLTGCTDSDAEYIDVSESVQPVTVYVRFGVQVAGSRDTRSVPVGDNNAKEDLLTSVTLFLISLKDDGITEDWTQVQHVTIYGSQTSNGYFSRIETLPGKKHVYVGANLSLEQINAISQSSDGKGLYNGNGIGYEHLISEFVTDDGIVMTGKRTGDITIQDKQTTTADSPLYIGEVELKRVVSKVLMVCDTYTGSTYVKLTAGQTARPTSDPGWIKLEDVRFSLNSTNRQVYLLKPEDAKDPNYEIPPYVTRDAGGNYQYTTAGKSAFDVCTPAEVWSVGMQPLAYDAAKMNVDGTTDYTEGFYCLENTVTTAPLSGGPAWNTASGNVLARLVTTHILVAAKFTPSTVIDGSGSTQSLTSPDDAPTRLPATTAADGEVHIAGTYFTRDGKKIYSYDGMIKAIADSNGKLTRDAFSTFEGGIGYYYTYIGGSADANGTLGFAAASGINRNDYCLVHITNFSVPSAQLSQPMRATMKVVDWEIKQSGSITVRPS